MAIRVVINNPTTKEEQKKLKERQSKALAETTLEILNNMLTPAQLEKLVKSL